MAKSDGRLDILGGQNMFDVFIPANNLARGDNFSQYDNDSDDWRLVGINQSIEDEAWQYALGEKTREEAVDAIKQRVYNEHGK